MIENQDYELVPNENDGWDIKLLTGDFAETIFNFGAIKVADDGETMKYSADIVYSPVDENYDENLEWHQLTGSILLSIMEQMIKNEAKTIES
jgi:hypothetical protein